MNREDRIQEGIERVRAVNERAYAPYSKFAVSAILYLPDEQAFVPGVNIENLSFGATICAERSAIAGAISQFAHRERGQGKNERPAGRVVVPRFGFIVVYTKAEGLTPPCGMCRQVIAEFAGEDFPVILANSQGMRKDYRLSELLPAPFESFDSSERA